MTLPTSEAEVAVQAIREAMADGMLIIAPYLSDPPPDPDAMPEGIDFAVRPLNQWCALLAATAAYFAGEAGYDEATLRQLAPVMRSGQNPDDDDQVGDRPAADATCVECGVPIWATDEVAGGWVAADGYANVTDHDDGSRHEHQPAAEQPEAPAVVDVQLPDDHQVPDEVHSGPKDGDQ